MVHLLQNELGHLPNLTVIQADILQTSIATLLTFSPPPQNRTPELQIADRKSQVVNSFKVVGNLPYYITSAVLRHLLETSPRPEQIVVTVQKEVQLQ